jgi:hypothetical protein
MTQDEIIEMAEQAGVAFSSDDYPDIWGVHMHVGKQEIEAFAKLVAEKATEETKARTYASWTLMCKKMVAFEREDIIQIIKETPFSNWFQADVIEAIRVRGEQA